MFESNRTNFFSENQNVSYLENANFSEKKQDVNGSDETSKFYPMSPGFPNSSPQVEIKRLAESKTPDLNDSAPFLYHIINDYEKSSLKVDEMLKELGLSIDSNKNLSEKLELFQKKI